MAVMIEAVVLDETTYEVPRMGDWLRVLRLNRREAARRMGIPDSNLCAAINGRVRLRGRALKAFAETVDIPAEVLVYRSPFDTQGKKWAKRAIMAEVEQRLSGESVAS